MPPKSTPPFSTRFLAPIPDATIASIMRAVYFSTGPFTNAVDRVRNTPELWPYNNARQAENQAEEKRKWTKMLDDPGLREKWMRNRVNPALPRAERVDVMEEGRQTAGEEGVGVQGAEEGDGAQKILELQKKIKIVLDETTLMEGKADPKQGSEKSEEWSVVSENEGIARAEVALHQEQLVPTSAPAPKPTSAPVQALNAAATPASPQQEEERLEPESVRTRIDIFEAARPTGGW